MRKNIDQIMASLKMMWALDKTVLIASLAIAVIDATLPFAGILLSAYVVDGLARGAGFQALMGTAAAVVVGVFLLTLTKEYLNRIKELHTEICVRAFDMKMRRRTLTMDYELLDSPKVNDIRARIQSDNNWGAGFSSMIWQLPQLFSAILGLFISAAIMLPLFLDGALFGDALSLAVLGFFFAILAANAVFTPAMKKRIYALISMYDGERTYRSVFLWGKMDYAIGKDIRVYNAKPLIQAYLDKDPPYRDEIDRMTKVNSRSGFADGVFSGLLMTASYLFVALRGASGALGIGEVLKYAATIHQFASQLNGVIRSFSEYSVSARRQLSTIEYMNIPDMLYKGTLPVEKRSDNDYEIEFHDVSFRYPGAERDSLRHVSLKFHVGQRLAVVGMNGSGKTTLIKLLCRLYDPTEGEITLNGIDIKKYNYEEYMRVFSVVFQDFKLFSFSLGQNVAADVSVDEEKAKRCLEIAGFSERLAQMPNGLNTPLYRDFEEEGVEISGGEAQKIALARALYKDAPFIILDEPTAALDPIAEFEIYSKFNEIVGDKTAIYISHRLSSCRFCDQIIVFDEGRIVQSGAHGELVNAEGKYRALWRAQAQYYDGAIAYENPAGFS